MRRVMISLLLLSACSEAEEAPDEVVRPVRYVEALGTGAGRSRAFSGTSQAGMSSTLSFKVSGTLDELPIQVGSRVDQGQLIARIDPTDYQLQLQEARAALNQAQAQMRNARSQYERTRALYENNNASRAELDGARSSFETSQAQVASSQKRVALARRQLDYTTLTAPEGGSIAALMVEINENVQPGTPVVTLSSGDLPEVKVGIPEVLISQVVGNEEVDITFDSIPGETFKGQVTEVGVAPESGGTTYPVIIRLNKDDSRIRPGLAAEIQLTFEAAKAGDDAEKLRFLLPPFAVGSDEQGTFVFVVEATDPGFGKVRRAGVEVGDLTTEGLEVLSGIEDGDKVVTAGISKIRDGQRVRLPAG